MNEVIGSDFEHSIDLLHKPIISSHSTMDFSPFIQRDADSHCNFTTVAGVAVGQCDFRIKSDLYTLKCHNLSYLFYFCNMECFFFFFKETLPPLPPQRKHLIESKKLFQTCMTFFVFFQWLKCTDKSNDKHLW